MDGQVIEDIESMFRDRPSWKLQYTSRVSNNVAHQLAKLALKCEEEEVWLEEGPTSIVNLIPFEN